MYKIIRMIIIIIIIGPTLTRASFGGRGGWGQRRAFASPCQNLNPPWNLQTLCEVWEQD